jgi:hypothetical protein
MGGGGLATFVDENIQPVLERDGRANLVYRDFKRVGSLPSRPMANHGRALGKKGIEKIQEQVAEIALPTRSSLVDDGVRVWIRAMKRIGEIVGEQGAKLRDRSPVWRRPAFEFDPRWRPVATCPGTPGSKLVGSFGLVCQRLSVARSIRSR